MIICSMTSWKNRISTIYEVILSLLNQTILPDKIYLNLSIEEFPNKELDIPENILTIINTIFNINWVIKNTKSIKKILPIIYLCDPNDIIINCDDDILYDKQFIEYRLNDLKRYNYKHPISSCNIPAEYTMGGYYFGAGSICLAKMLYGYEAFINKEVLSTYEDDHIYTAICYLNGYKTMPCSKYSIKNYKFINQENGGGFYNTIYTYQIIYKRLNECAYRWNERVKNFNKKISIVTITKNNDNIIKTINSIYRQLPLNIEHIIINGGEKSTVIEEYSKLDYVKVINEDDTGIYNAMNKGIDIANGDYILFLNAGDYLVDDSLELVYEQLDGTELIYGDIYLVQDKRIQKYPKNLYGYIDNHSIGHPAAFISTALLKNKKYDEHYKIISDWIWFREMIYKISYKHIDIVVSCFDQNGISNTNLCKEEHEAYNKQISR